MPYSGPPNHLSLRKYSQAKVTGMQGDSNMADGTILYFRRRGLPSIAPVPSKPAIPPLRKRLPYASNLGCSCQKATTEPDVGYRFAS